jgi:hypothetical protein
MTVSTFIAKIRSILASPTLFRWIIALFLVQALLSLVFISPSTPKDGVGGKYVQRNENGVVPDGHRHIGAIYYYAEQPILQGPTIPSMSDNDLWMGDLVRFPSYLYYYVLSFPVRIAMAFNASDTAVIYLIRLIGVVFGLVALLTFRRITQLVTSSVTIQNISTLALALTGSFVWLSAAENYDIMALMLWFAFVYVSMSLFIKKDARYLYWMALWFLVLSITKYTYIPFMGLFGLISLGLYAKNKEVLSIKPLWHSINVDISAWIRKLRVWQTVLAIVVLVASVGLFSERIIGNLAAYHSFNPDCARLHSQEACMNFGVYARNYNQKIRVENGTATPIGFIQAVGYPAFWVKRYFDSMYVYMGHIYIPHYSVLIELAGIVGIAIGIRLLVLAKKKRIRIFKSQSELYLLAIVMVLTVMQFIFNLNTVLHTSGAPYAHQGRYLLPVVGFAYILYLIVLRRVLARQSTKKQRTALLIGLVVAAYAILIVSAVPSFLIHGISPNWYSQIGQDILPDWITNRS